MKSIRFNLFPGLKRRAVTFSYDDGREFDVRLAEIFDRFGARCTFNLNASNIGRERYIDKAFVKELSLRHEVACHAYTHPFLERLPVDRIVAELIDDRKQLEDITGKPIIGMAYPYGTHDGDVRAALRACGIRYGRTTAATNAFNVPDDYITWNPSCHHRGTLKLADSFLQKNAALPLFYVWGHSFEFDSDGNWQLMEELLTRLSERDDIWYATNAEIYDYYCAIKALRITFDGSCAYNPTAVTVYAEADGKAIALRPGENNLI